MSRCFPSVFSALLASLLLGCSGTPSESAGRQVIERRIEKQSNGLIELVEFKKTNGAGDASTYQMEFSTTVRYKANCLVGSLDGRMETLPDFRAIPGTRPSAMQFYLTGKTAGETETHTGTMLFQKTERGWQGPDGNLY